MNLVADLLMVLGAGLAVLASIGVVRFSTPYARFHAAGKASPVGFLVAAVGASIRLGWSGSGLLLVASVAMVLTLPVGVHLLFRAVHRTSDNTHLAVDQLAQAEAELRGPNRK